MSKQYERIELNHIINEEALLFKWSVTEVSGSIEQVLPGRAVFIERKGVTFDAALSLLKEETRGD